MNDILTKRDHTVIELRKMSEDRAGQPGAQAKFEAFMLSLEADRVALENEQVRVFVKYLRKGNPPQHCHDVKVLDTLQGPGGGYSVPPPIVREILPQATTLSPIRQYATVRTLTEGDAYPLPRQKNRPAVAWRKETEPHPVMTTMDFAGEMIPVHDLVSTISASTKFVDDPAVDIEQWLITSVRDAFSEDEGRQFIIGDGVRTPEGMLIHPGVVSIPSGSASTLTGDGVVGLFYALPEPFRARAYWLANKGTIEVIKKLKDSGGTPVFKDGWYGLAPDTILGRPVIDCPDMPDITANSTPLLFGDLRRYYIVDRVDMAVLRDPFMDKPNIIFDCTRRVGGQIVDATAFKKQVIST